MRIFALRTDAEELDSVSEDAVIVEIISHTPQKVKRWAVNIVNPAAFYAANVMVRGQIAIESSFLAAKLQFLYYARPSQQIEVAIHSAEADFGQASGDKPVQPHRSRVRGELSEFFQNHLTLLRIALWSLAFHCELSYY
jgi:hypothetical protein